MRPPRVVFVSGNAPPTIDGVGDYTNRLLQHLRPERPEWSWFWLSRRPRWFSPPLRRRNGITRLQPGHTWTHRDLTFVRSSLAVLKPDILHIQDQIHSFHETDAAAQIAKAARSPVVTTLHEFHVELTSVCHSVDLVHASDHLIANDRRCAARCLELTSREPDHIWWSPSNVPPLDPGWSVQSTPGAVTTFGQINRIRSFYAVRDALQKLRARIPSLRWHIVGPFAPQSEPLHAKLAADLNADWITFTGGTAQLDDRDFRIALAQSECMILPYRDGASPRRTTLQTAWALGIPTITSAPEVYEPDIVDGTNCVLVKEDTAEAWERALERVLFNDELKRELREGALSTAERFSWPKLTRKHLDLYESVLDGR